MDGGLTNSLPILPVGRTVTISPFSGRLDISPQDRGRLNLYLNVTNQDITVSVHVRGYAKPFYLSARFGKPAAEFTYKLRPLGSVSSNTLPHASCAWTFVLTHYE